MYKGQFIKTEDLINKINQEEVMFQFLGIWPSLYQKYKSPFRNDKFAGCRFEWKNGLLYFVDNAKFQNRLYWSIFDIVKHVKQCSYREALGHIAKGRYTQVKSVPVYKPKKEIRFTYKEWSFDNLFDLSPEILLKENIYLVDKFWKGENNQWILQQPTDLCIAYWFKQTNRSKLYFPEREENRWYSNCTNEDIFGLETLNQNGDILIITKSQKDRVTLKYHYNIENVIAVQNEGCYIPDNIMKDLKNRFNRIIIIFDNDLTGYSNAEKLSSKYNIEYRIIEMDCKDIYEAYKKNYKIL